MEILTQLPKSPRLILSLFLLIFICTEVFAEPLRIFVSIEPQVHVVEKVGGENVRVSALVPVNQDPHAFTVTPRQVIELNKAALYFTIGMPFEARIQEKVKGAQKGIRFVEMLEDLPEYQEVHDHDHGHPDHDDCETRDPHTWLSPPLLISMTKKVLDELSFIDPTNVKTYETNAALFINELEKCHAVVQEKLRPFQGRSVYIFHPDLTWFCSTYDLKQITVQMGGKTPTPRDLQRLIEQVIADGAKTIFVQPQFDARAAKALASAIGAELVSFNPMEKDILSNIYGLTDNIVRSFTE